MGGTPALEEAERSLRAWGYAFGALFGNPKVYGSSGYRVVKNPLHSYDIASKERRVEPKGGMLIKELGNDAWPEGEIDLRGPHF